MFLDICLSVDVIHVISIFCDSCSPFTLRGQRLKMADNCQEITVQNDDSSEAVKHTQPSVRVAAPTPSTSGGTFCSGLQPTSSAGFGFNGFSSVPSTSSSYTRPPLYPFGQGASFPPFTGHMTAHEMQARAQQQWPTFSPFAQPNPFYGAYFNPAEQMNQLQQSVKRLEEQFAASNSKQSADQPTGQEISNRRAGKSRAHNISENETGLSDISSEEESCSGNDSDAEIDDRGNPIPSTSGVSFKNLMDSAKKQSPQDSKLDKLDQLSQDFEEKESFGEKINDKLAKTVNSGMKALFSKNNANELSKKYNTPENCEWVRVPLINPELWNSDGLSDSYKASDKLLYKNQKLVTKAMLPIIQIMNQCIEKDSDNTTFELACDAFQMLSYAHRDSSNIRRHMLKPAVSKTYRKLCSPSTPISEFLFGDDLHKQIKDLNETKKFTHEISTNKYKRKSPYNDSDGRSKKFKYPDRQYGAYRSDRDSRKNFLDKRARPFQRKPRNQAAGRKQ